MVFSLVSSQCTENVMYGHVQRKGHQLDYYTSTQIFVRGLQRYYSMYRWLRKYKRTELACVCVYVRVCVCVCVCVCVRNMRTRKLYKT